MENRTDPQCPVCNAPAEADEQGNIICHNDEENLIEDDSIEDAKPLEEMTFEELREYARFIGGSSITRLPTKPRLIAGIRRYEEQLRERKAKLDGDWRLPIPAASAPDVFGTDHPTIQKAMNALTHHGSIPVEEISRAQAERLLSMWAHFNELTEREATAVLNRFPVTVSQEHHRITVNRYKDGSWSWKCFCDGVPRVGTTHHEILNHACGMPAWATEPTQPTLNAVSARSCGERS